MRRWRGGITTTIALTVVIATVLGFSLQQLVRSGLTAEAVRLDDAHGRVAAEPVTSTVDLPPFPSSAMDGFAVDSHATAAASAATPVRVRVGTDAVPIDTGAAMPDGRDAVVPLEAAKVAGGIVTVTSPVAAGKHVRLPGDDVPPGVAIGWPGFALRPVDCAALIASGCTSVDVVRRPRVAVIPSGDELVAPGSPPRRSTASRATRSAPSSTSIGSASATCACLSSRATLPATPPSATATTAPRRRLVRGVAATPATHLPPRSSQAVATQASSPTRSPPFHRSGPVVLRVDCPVF